jgi:hypothetical protein
MYRSLAKIVCLSLTACTSATLLIDLASAQTTISGDIVGTKERGCLALLSGSFGPAPFCFKFV